MIDIGVSYSGSRVIGSSMVDWQPHAGFQASVRIIEETMTAPAVLVGFDSQGSGPFIRSGGRNRFRLKSRGGYIVVSRNYSLLGDMGLHAGANYSLEDEDGDHDPSFWTGINKSLGSVIELCAEYDFAVNDNGGGSMEAENGYLNAALKWRFGGSFTLEFDMTNLLRNPGIDGTGRRIEEPEPSRELRFFYTGRF